jgi:very-short-patch-repair endonuclease
MDVPPRKTVIRARKLRREMTLPEVLLWNALRAASDGFRFRRQHPVGPYVLDFFCPSVRLAVEVDGAAHDMGDNPARDEQRDAWLERQGIRTLRIPAREVLADVEVAMTFVRSACAVPFPSTIAFGDGPPPRSGEDF